MSSPENPSAAKCSLCGVTESEHRELYGTSLGQLTFSFQPDKGPAVRGQIRLCRPCTHGVLSRRLLHAAGVPDEVLAPDVWN
jgi:hypothetical protein